MASRWSCQNPMTCMHSDRRSLFVVPQNCYDIVTSEITGHRHDKCHNNEKVGNIVSMPSDTETRWEQTLLEKWQQRACKIPGSHRPRPQHRGARSPPPSVVVRERHTAPNLHSLPVGAQRWQALSRRGAAPQLPPDLLLSPKTSPHCSAPPSRSVGHSLLGTCELACISAREGQCLPPGGWDSCGAWSEVRSRGSPQGRPLRAAEVSLLLSGPREAVLVPSVPSPPLLSDHVVLLSGPGE